MKLKLKELLTKMLVRSIATYSNGVLSMGNLRIHIGQVNVPSTGQATINFPSGTFSQVFWAIPYCGQGGFGAYDTMSILSLTNTAATVYQLNSAGALMLVNVITFGLA